MENFVFGLQNIAMNISSFIPRMFFHPTIQGFLIGFAIATLINILLSSQAISTIPYMLTKKAPKSFEKIASKNPKGTYLISYSTFLHEYNQVRTSFYFAISLFLVVVTIALLKY